MPLACTKPFFVEVYKGNELLKFTKAICLPVAMFPVCIGSGFGLIGVAIVVKCVYHGRIVAQHRLSSFVSPRCRGVTDSIVGTFFANTVKYLPSHALFDQNIMYGVVLTCFSHVFQRGWCATWSRGMQRALPTLKSAQRKTRPVCATRCR